LRALAVSVENTHGQAISIAATATERARGARKALDYASQTKTVAAGDAATFVLRTPRALRKQLAEQLKRGGRLVRRPAITLTNTATGGKLVLRPRLRLNA
jgi:hypothetical protein